MELISDMMKKISLLFLFLLSIEIYPQNFRFAVWGDSQFQNPEVFEETVLRTELLKPDFVIHVGDMIHGYTYSIKNARKQWQRFKKQIAPLSVPFYPTPGNHDLTTKEIQPAYLETWGNDKLYYSFSYQNSYFIILNVFLNQQFDTIPPVEMDWLKQELEKAKTKDNIFISLHSPLYLSRKYNWDAVHNLFKQYPVKAVFSGHSHIYDYREIDGIKYFCLNSSGNMDTYNEAAGRSHHFLWMTVRENDVDAAVITREHIYPADYILPGEASYSSRSLDKNGTIIINDPAAGIDTTVLISVTNKSDYKKNYRIVPSTNDFRWKFSVSGFNIFLDPGETRQLPFHMTFPGGDFNRTNLPWLDITTEYFSQRKARAEHKFVLHLFTPPEAAAVQTSEKIILDGKDDDKSWRYALPIEELYQDKNLTPATEKTAIKLLYDTDNIYVYIRGNEPNPDGLIKSAYGDLPLVFGDDDFELYFDTNRDLKTFYRLMVNPAGTTLCSGPEGLFSFSFEVKTFTGNDFWAAEFKIPLKELRILNKIKGSSWGFNVRRHRQQAEVPQSDWSKMNTHPPYQPEYFGILYFR